MCAVASEDVRAGVGRIGENAQHARMGEPTPAQLASPHAAVRSTRKAELAADGRGTLGALHATGQDVQLRFETGLIATAM